MDWNDWSTVSTKTRLTLELLRVLANINPASDEADGALAQEACDTALEFGGGKGRSADVVSPIRPRASTEQSGFPPPQHRHRMMRLR